ncbi:MAG: amidohydrolase family protein, partial [Pseudomonadota bacterium]
RHIPILWHGLLIKMHRRTFLKATGALAPFGLTACSNDVDPARYSQEDADFIVSHADWERANSGTGPFGRHTYPGYRGLAQLPWFELDADGQLVCVDESVPRSTDIHCHLGMSLLFEPTLDLQQRHPRTKHLLDCDAKQPGCDLDLDVYANTNFSDDALDTLSSTLTAQGLWGSDFAKTQTIANLLVEMEAMRVDKAILLPIKFNFWFGDRQTDVWQSEVSKNGTEKLQVGMSVSPHQDKRLEEMRTQFNNGRRILKLHPTVQRFYPDHRQLENLYAMAQELGVIVFFHGGRAGIEPASSQPYALPRHYEWVFKNFPKLKCVIGHAGARDVDGMLELAERYDNIWLDIHGQSITQLNRLIERLGHHRVLYGTDWPFYHIGMSLAKVLIVTDNPNRSDARSAILSDNAERLLNS